MSAMRNRVIVVGAAATVALGAIADAEAHRGSRGSSSVRASHSGHSTHSTHSTHSHGHRASTAISHATRVVVVPSVAYYAPARVAYVAPPVYVPPPVYVAPQAYAPAPGYAVPSAPVVPPPAANTWRPVPGPFLAVDGASFVAGGITYVLSGLAVNDVSTPHGAAARARLQQLLSSGQVSVWRIAVDGYGRSIARVVVNGADLSVKMRQEGYARA